MTDLNNRVIYLRRHRAHDPEYDMPARDDAAPERISLGWAWAGAIALAACALLVGLCEAGWVS